MTVVIRSSGVDPDVAHPDARGRSSPRSIPNLPVTSVQTMEEVVSASVGQPRLLSALTGLFGALAGLLAMVGVYGVTSYNVRRQRREFGIRLALGADPGAVQRLIVGRGAMVAAVGVAIGARRRGRAPDARAGVDAERRQADRSDRVRRQRRDGAAGLDRRLLHPGALGRPRRSGRSVTGHLAGVRCSGFGVRGQVRGSGFVAAVRGQGSWCAKGRDFSRTALIMLQVARREAASGTQHRVAR